MGFREIFVLKIFEKKHYYVLILKLRRIASSNRNPKMFIAIIDPTRIPNKPNSNGTSKINDKYPPTIKVITIVSTNVPKNLCIIPFFCEIYQDRAHAIKFAMEPPTMSMSPNPP